MHPLKLTPIKIKNLRNSGPYIKRTSQRNMYRLPIFNNFNKIYELQFVFRRNDVSPVDSEFPLLKLKERCLFTVSKVGVIICDKLNRPVNYKATNGIINLSHLPYGLYVLKLEYDKKEVYKTVFYPPK